MDEYKQRTESEFGANDGVSAATHDLTVWLENDAALSEWAKKIAKGNKFEYGDNELHENVYDLLYDNDAASFFNLASPGIIRARNEYREKFSKQEIDGIEWAYVRSSLLAE